MSHPIYTIGYEGCEVMHLAAELRRAGVARLVDIRAVANSRKPGFSKHVLARRLAEDGIAYTHLKPLGTPRAGRDAAKAGDVAGMTRIYAEQLALPEAQLALQEAQTLAVAEPMALLCFEADHAGCHRHIVADALAARTRQAIVHLHPAPPAEPKPSRGGRRKTP